MICTAGAAFAVKRDGGCADVAKLRADEEASKLLNVLTAVDKLRWKAEGATAE